MIQVVFFGQLRERMKTGSLQLDGSGINSVAELKQQLAAMDSHWRSVLENEAAQLLAAVNQQMGNDTTPVKDGDEVALFPPVTGG